MISQLASTGKVRKMFAHCLDGLNGGGIFAIGHIVQPKVNMTPLVPNQYVYIFLSMSDQNKEIFCEVCCSFFILVVSIVFPSGT